ncbi:MAG TPA: tetratricopeptide repeat protein [Pirellulales bacterium]|nr:tetratricopeptide repeat protein [Pirellulales bacterium]
MEIGRRGEAWAHKCLVKGDDYQAIDVYSEVLLRNADDAEAYRDRGFAYVRTGDHEHGIADLTRSLELDPKSADAYFRRATAYHKALDFKRAVNDCDTAIKLGYRPEDLVYRQRARAYMDQGRLDLAIADFSQILRVSDDRRAYYERGLAWSKKGDIDKAISDFTNGIESAHGPYPECYLQRGYAYLLKDEPDNAIDDFTEAARNYYLRRDACFGRAKAFMEKRASKRAVAEFTQAIRLTHDDPAAEADAYLERGRAYEQQGLYRSAKRDFATAKKLRYED